MNRGLWHRVTARTSRAGNRQGGSALLSALVFIFIMSTLMVFLLVQAGDQASADRWRRESAQALYEAFGELEMARTVIADSAYDADGQNQAVRQALESPGHEVEGTDVTIEPLTGENGSWYLATARCPYDDGRSERVVRRAFRDRDYFSSYNLFVSDDPAGIAGSPIGAIHTNRKIQFYFPNGLYRHSVTAVEGAEYRAGATDANTTIAGPFNPGVERIDLNLMGDENFGFSALKKNVQAAYAFPADRDIAIALERCGGDQNLSVEVFSQPRIEYETEEVLTGYRDVNPHEVEVQFDVQEISGYETKTRLVTVDEQVLVPIVRLVPVYRSEIQVRSVPIYRREERTRQVPVYGYVTKTRMVSKQVWVWDPVDLSGGTAIGGDGGQTGHYETVMVEQTYQERVIVSYTTQTYYVNVIDHYEDRQYTVQVVDHYDEVPDVESRTVQKTVEETYQDPIYQTVTKTETQIVYDQEPIYETVERPIYISRQKLEEVRLPAPSNGVVYAAGNVIGIKGDVVGRLTIATEGFMRITGNVVYRDAEGDPAYLNGSDPGLPYGPNPNYNNGSILGLIARQDLIYTTDIPDNFEINASLMSMEGRVGVDGITLGAEGEVTAYNAIADQFGRATGGIFRKNSIRRLGGITTCRRPVDTVVMQGLIKAGFTRGTSAFDVSVLASPPPFFLARPIARFFATEIVK